LNFITKQLHKLTSYKQTVITQEWFHHIRTYSDYWNLAFQSTLKSCIVSCRINIVCLQSIISDEQIFLRPCLMYVEIKTSGGNIRQSL